MKGFIKLPRDFVEWEWWNRQPHHPLFEWLLVKARVDDRKIQGTIVRRGSLLTSWNEMQQAVGCSRGALSRALKDLSECGEIITRTDCKKTVVTICHYEDYNGYSNTLWTDCGLIADCERTDTPIIKREQENEKDIYSACAQGFSDDGFVSDGDCRQWMQRYNKIAAGYGAAPAEQLNTKRRLYIQQRVRERGRGAVDVMFQKLEQSAYFFADGSRGFRGDFTNLWTADVFAKVCEGYFIPRKKEEKAAAAAPQHSGPAVPWTESYVREPQGQSREEWERQMRRWAAEDPQSRAAKIVASWNA